MNIQQLRAQIAALQDATMDENKNFPTAYDEGKFDAFSAVDALLDSFEEEPVSKELEEAYCSFEVAKLLKEKGFDGECSGFYMLNGSGRWKYEHYHNFDISDRIDCPTHQMAMAWLREHGLHINAVISYDYSVDADGNEVDRWTFWLFEIFSSFSGNLIYTEEVNQYDSYKEAIEAALKYVLENLI